MFVIDYRLRIAKTIESDIECELKKTLSIQKSITNVTDIDPKTKFEEQLFL